MKKSIKNTSTIIVLGFILLLLQHDLSGYIPQAATSIRSVDSSHQTNTKNFLTQLSDLKSIRKWGCNRTETPLIFVHIGKSGGGSTRARFAAAAENVTRAGKWKLPTKDEHFYPIRTNYNGIQYAARGKFCNSLNIHYRMPEMKRFHNKGYEGMFDCHATTPLGRIVGCPSFWAENGACMGCSDMNDPGCHTVYVGHNYFGNELHWLPAPYLQAWWKENWAASVPASFSSRIQDGMRSLTLGTYDPVWCAMHNKTRTASRNDVLRDGEGRHKECSKDISEQMDTMFQKSWDTISANTNLGKNYAPLYGSLPLHRIVLLREPFSWMVSRFFWNEKTRISNRCDDFVFGSHHNGTMSYAQSGWAYKLVIEHLFYLCGEDCINRYETGAITLDEIEDQAEANLRHSFSVVGLLNETNEFYDMITARIQVR